MKPVSTITALAVRPGETAPRVSSLNLAKNFDRDHKNVLQAIRHLIAECPSEFVGANFQPSNYRDSQNKNQEQYLLTRDAFCLLSMSFTGAKALAWKVRYIEAFNEMERRLLDRRLLPDTPDGAALIRRGLYLARRLTPGRKRLIKRAARYAALGLGHAEIGRLLRCGTEKARLLLQEHAWIAGPPQEGGPK
jgi:Rha family phage regulatory protein